MGRSRAKKSPTQVEEITEALQQEEQAETATEPQPEAPQEPDGFEELFDKQPEEPVEESIVIEAPQQKALTIVFDRICIRHHERLAIQQGSKELDGPDVSDPESQKAHTDALKDLDKKWRAACSGVGRDMQVLIASLRCIEAERGIDINEVINKVAESFPLASDRPAPAPVPVKETKELPGQLKLVNDDGSIAEEAIPCVTRPLDEIETTGEVEEPTEDELAEAEKVE